MDKELKTRIIQIVLFVVTFITTTLAGAEWTYSKSIFFGMEWEHFVGGMAYSIPFLGILTVHEFGHYFTAKYHNIKVSLPYYIPMWFGISISIGTMGAFIRIREHINSRLKYFDVGVSGPIAGFVVAVFVLFYGFTNLPPADHIYTIHPEYLEYATINEAIESSEGMVINLGGNLLFSFFQEFVADTSLLPHENELMHYPWLLAGYLALFFTALNLLPIGQLDGGHVLFGLVGPKNHAIISRIFFTAFVFYAGLGIIDLAYLRDALDGNATDIWWKALYLFATYWASFSVFPETRNRLLFVVSIFTGQLLLNLFTGWIGYSGWLLFAILIGRFIGVDHPPVYDDRPLSLGRKIIGWLALVIFILCFSPKPLVIDVPQVVETQ